MSVMNINKRNLYTTVSALVVSGPLVAQTQPNIVLFLVDDMGWQDTSVPFGAEVTKLNEIYHTPNMERLAQKGVKFTHAYANSISSPSRVSLFTGANAARHRVTNWTLEKNVSTDRKNDLLEFGDWNYNGLCPEEGVPYTFYAKCLPELLRENGYTTMMVGKAHFGSLDTPAADPLTIGFDYNIAGHAAGAMGSYLGEEGYGATGNPEWAKIWAVPNLEKYHGTDTFLTEALTLEAKGLMDKALLKQKPFFLYMSHYAVHAPFATDKRFYDKYIAKGLSHKEAQYAGLVEGMDKSLGDLMDYLEEKNLQENTVILFMSDNGGLAAHTRAGQLHTQNYPLNSGKGSAYEGGVREPMIVSWPGTVKPGSKCDRYLMIEDFFPSILEIAGISDYQTIQQRDGISFMPLLTGKGKMEDRDIYWHYPHSWGPSGPGIGATCAIRSGDWKLVYYFDSGKRELFNIPNDISEKHDLAAQKPRIVKQLAGKLSNYLRSVNAQRPTLRATQQPAPWPDEIK